MAKYTQSNSERSKVRFFYVEGEFGPGELRELTQAFSAAVRPTQVVMRPATPARLAAPAPVDGNGSAMEIEPEVEITEGDAVDAAEVEPPAKRSPKPRQYRKPEPVDIDLNVGDKPWREFAAEKATGASSHRTKYLVAAAWLHDYAKLATISANHVFTCYKAAGWNFDIGDTTVTFRQLKSEGLGKLNRGQFGINHLGIAEVNDMKASA